MTKRPTTNPRPGEGDPTGPRLAAGLSKLSNALRSLAWRSRHEADLTPTQGQTLTTLESSPGMRLGDLAAALGVTLATASEAVTTLVERGLVDRERDPRDARAVVLSTTRRGRAAAHDAAQWPDAMLHALDALDEGERQVMLRVVLKLIKGLQDDGVIARARMCPTCAYFQPGAHPGSALPHHCALADAALGPEHLRPDCREHEALGEPERSRAWDRYVAVPFTMSIGKEEA